MLILIKSFGDIGHAKGYSMKAVSITTCVKVRVVGLCPTNKVRVMVVSRLMSTKWQKSRDRFGVDLACALLLLDVLRLNLYFNAWGPAVLLWWWIKINILVGPYVSFTVWCTTRNAILNLIVVYKFEVACNYKSYPHFAFVLNKKSDRSDLVYLINFHLAQRFTLD